MELRKEFKQYLKNEDKSQNTISGYVRNVQEYMSWFQESFGKDFSILLRQNILEYKSYLHNVKKINGKTINHKMSSLKKFNQFLIEKGIQRDLVIEKGDKVRIQQQYASPTDVDEKEVKNFLQRVLEAGNSRNYALVMLFTYAGLRISETLCIELDDYNLTSGECIMRNAKGKKQRIVYLNSKVGNALKAYLKHRDEYNTSQNSNYLFVSQKRGKLDRTTVNRIFNQFDDKITPHQLRHFFCSNALEKNMSIHEVANQAGHSSVQTTLLYTNPEKRKIKAKMEEL